MAPEGTVEENMTSTNLNVVLTVINKQQTNICPSLSASCHVSHKASFSLGFCNLLGFKGAGDWPTAQPPTWRNRGCSLSGLYPSTNPAWLDLPGTGLPSGTALRVNETCKPHHHDKVPAYHLN